MSNLDFVLMPKTIDRKFAPAATKLSVSQSSLSNDNIGAGPSEFAA